MWIEIGQDFFLNTDFIEQVRVGRSEFAGVRGPVTLYVRAGGDEVELEGRQGERLLAAIRQLAGAAPEPRPTAPAVKAALRHRASDKEAGVVAAAPVDGDEEDEDA